MIASLRRSTALFIAIGAVSILGAAGARAQNKKTLRTHAVPRRPALIFQRRRNGAAAERQVKPNPPPPKAAVAPAAAGRTIVVRGGHRSRWPVKRTVTPAPPAASGQATGTGPRKE